jgi:hypothetical protein
MEVLGLLQVLWRRRLALALGAIAAVAAAVAIGTSPPTSYGVGWARVVLDTPESQEVDTKPSGADTLPWRASLLVHLLSGDRQKRDLARRLGIPVGDLAIIDPELSAPEATASLPSAAAKLAGIDPAPYVLTVYRSTDLLPMISIEGAAPDTAKAARLVRAAVDTLKSEGHPTLRVRSPTGPDGSPELLPVDRSSLQGFVVDDVTPVRARPVASGRSPIVPLMAALALLTFWAFVVVAVPRAVRGVRSAFVQSSRTQDRELVTR